MSKGETLAEREAYHEVWWIHAPEQAYLPERRDWGGLRIAHFRKIMNGEIIFIIQGETDQRRIGIRIWADVAPVEGWVKVKQISIPTLAEINAAMDAKLREIDRETLTGSGL